MLRSVIKLTLLLGSLSLASGLSIASDVYKYTDENGHVQYTDKPPTLPAERLALQSKKADPAEVQARQSEEMKRLEAADSARKEKAGEKSDKTTVTQLSAKDRVERCTKARDRYDGYINSQRLYEEKPGGERRYLTSEELDAARATAKANMDTWCK